MTCTKKSMGKSSTRYGGLLNERSIIPAQKRFRVQHILRRDGLAHGFRWASAPRMQSARSRERGTGQAIGCLEE